MLHIVFRFLSTVLIWCMVPTHISGVILSWFWSYLTGRQQIVVCGVRLAPSLVEYGVPLGSVLGPILFVSYMMPLNEIFSVILSATTLLLATHNSNGHVHWTLFKVLFAKWRTV